MPTGIYIRKNQVVGRKKSPLGIPVGYRTVQVYFPDDYIDLKQRIDRIVVDYRRQTGQHLPVGEFIRWVLSDFISDVTDEQVLYAMKKVFGTARTAENVLVAKILTRQKNRKAKEKEESD